jgi:hypothetical protein
MSDFAKQFGVRLYERGEGVIHQLCLKSTGGAR